MQQNDSVCHTKITQAVIAIGTALKGGGREKEGEGEKREGETEGGIKRDRNTRLWADD